MSSPNRNACNWGIPVLTLDKINPLDHPTEFPCPDESCEGTVTLLETAHFFRKQEEDPRIGPVDLGFETNAWQCNVCHLYVVPAETFQTMMSTTIEEALVS